MFTAVHVPSSPNSSSAFQAVLARLYSLVSELDELICEILVLTAAMEKFQVFWDVTPH
jgi:hypothetical protein